MQLHEIPPGDVVPEKETAEILAATWKEKRAEIARLQHSRKFNQASIELSRRSSLVRCEVGEVRRQTRCFKCQKVDHWARNCPKKGVQGDEKAPAGSCDIPEMARRRSPTRWCVCTWKSMASRLASWRQRAVIQGDAPLLLSRSTMKSLRAVTDFELRRRPCRCKQMDLDA